MGFFKDFKRDFAQAVNELVPDQEENEQDIEQDNVDEARAESIDQDIEYYSEGTLENLDETNFNEDPKVEDEEPKDYVIPDGEYDTDEVEEEESSNDIPEASVINENNTDIDINSLDASLENDALSEGDDIMDTVIEDDVLMQEYEDNDTKENDAKDGDAKDDDADKIEDIQSEEKVEEEYMQVASEKEPELVDSRFEESTSEDIFSEDTTYITKGTTISGDIETQGGIDIIGTVKGNVDCGGKLIIGGIVEGNITSSDLYANSAKITGEIVVSNSIKIGLDSKIVGNISATSAVIAGAVKGDIDVQGPVIVDSTAVIVGNIKSSSVQINNGAVIEGFCSQTYADIDVKSYFE